MGREREKKIGYQMPLNEKIKNGLPVSLVDEWKIGMCEAPVKEPGQFCYGLCCPCCAAYGQRDELLQMTGEEYYCCGGIFPCGPLGQPCDKDCLILEAGCCPSCAITGNRWIIQTRFVVNNGPCDDFIILFTCLVSWAICILETAGVDVPDEIEFAVNFLEDVVFACMHAQQHRQIQYQKNDKGGFQQVPQQVIMLYPEKQQQMMMNNNNYNANPGGAVQMGRPVQQSMGGGGGGGFPPQMMQQQQPQQQMYQQGGYGQQQQQQMYPQQQGQQRMYA